jgi:hypothetical protein
LESYHPYLLPQEVSKSSTTLGTYSSLPKIRKGRFGFLRPLGVNLPYEGGLLEGLKHWWRKLNASLVARLKLVDVVTSTITVARILDGQLKNIEDINP